MAALKGLGCVSLGYELEPVLWLLWYKNVNPKLLIPEMQGFIEPL
jgi:hypothetical protein